MAFDITSYLYGYEAGQAEYNSQVSDQDTETASQDPEDAETDEEQDSDT